MKSVIAKKTKLLVVQQFILQFLLIGGLIFFSGCSAKRGTSQDLSTHNVPPAFKVLENTYWWKCKFRNVRGDDDETDWGLDLLLAHAVVSPVLVEHIDDIPYWRFHRRATRDKTGHQFSFLFYSNPATASAVFSEINQSKVLQGVIDANLVKKVIMDDPDDPKRPSVEDTSDSAWSLDLQENWPSFIMGASSLWLGLIDNFMEDSPEDFADSLELLEKYREVNDEIAEVWREEGQHALLHHLNAVFGYEPLRIRKELSF